MSESRTNLDSDEGQFQEEWLSAYLDDELSSDQRRTVEERLTNDPNTQLLLEDLKRIRNLVGQLPGWEGPGLNVAWTTPQETTPQELESHEKGYGETELDRVEELLQQDTVNSSVQQSEMGALLPETETSDATTLQDNSLDRVEEIIAEDGSPIGAQSEQPSSPPPERTSEVPLASNHSCASDSDSFPPPEPAFKMSPHQTHEPERTASESAEPPAGESSSASWDTESPVTESPVTESPVTESPVTESPVTESPVTESPVTDATTSELNESESLVQNGVEGDSEPVDSVVSPANEQNAVVDAVEENAIDGEDSLVDQANLVQAQLVSGATPSLSFVTGWMRPVAMAASLLVMVGLGYGLWAILPRTSWQGLAQQVLRFQAEPPQQLMRWRQPLDRSATQQSPTGKLRKRKPRQH